jgi:hypothetical protein
MAKRQNSEFLVGLTSVAVFFLATGCSSFQRDWKAAAQTPATTGDVAGAWDGQWLSNVNGHRGRLQCILTKKTEALYDARFKARFWKIFSASYTVPLNITPGTNGSFHLDGESDLGKLAGGVYHYAGEANPTLFNTQYSNKYDHGAFQMKRPPAQ